jgi:hypothetical protein
MFDTLRKPLFIAALILLALTVLTELGSSLFIDANQPGGAAKLEGVDNPGFGISYLALIDGLLLFSIGLMGASLIVPDRVQGRVQGFLTFGVSLFVLMLSFYLLTSAITLLTLMVALLMASPFGTAVYMEKFADFDTGKAGATLSVIMSLKLGFVVCLVLAHQRFLENKGLIFIILSSFAVTIILAILHGIRPTFLVSITDDIGAIVSAVIAIIWALLYFLWSVPAIIKVLRVDRAFK